MADKRLLQHALDGWGRIFVRASDYGFKLFPLVESFNVKNKRPQNL